MNLLPEVFVKVIATIQAQCVNTPDFPSLRAVPQDFSDAVKKSTSRNAKSKMIDKK